MLLAWIGISMLIRGKWQVANPGPALVVVVHHTYQIKYLNMVRSTPVGSKKGIYRQILLISFHLHSSLSTGQQHTPILKTLLVWSNAPTTLSRLGLLDLQVFWQIERTNPQDICQGRIFKTGEGCDSLFFISKSFKKCEYLKDLF